MKDTILGFGGEYRWMSNFHPVEINYLGRIWPTTEHAYQAAKSLDPKVREKIWLLDSPGKAKRLSRKIEIRWDWDDDLKLQIMLDLQRLKYEHPDLRANLIATRNLMIEETNHWGDVFWGVCDGVGKNNLGKIMMQVRSEIQEK